ncbi:coiled-coil domain-containing protein 93 isoform X2 [Toxorhynchites rutilus septentrionalis]|uniref:coiled-coil domain-containing protein 93 isoform X2 n=1 Tax=Toxorhynchites rutilus septentrionalis TaxID=329112 RepID=UPI0024787601|nr:coiled-coil domain-containing protein 93 isoform X2 [Toxorhynchites rutilus septentrionalis]
MSSKNIFSKHLPNVKLATRFDADGNEIQVERREDEEQKRKEQEIIDILVGAGYYRAHIQGLSMFDKIVGGMTWCIEACDYDVDVDLLFHENLTIGQKIALTEKIVVVLPKMKCPFQLEPHQIQGLDFINIYPVVEWLVKRSAENRSEKAEKLKKLAASQFQNYFTLQSDLAAKQLHTKQLDNLKTIEDRYIPKRQFKRKEKGPDDVMSRVRITLMEYGTRDFTAKTNVDIAEIDDAHESEDVFGKMLEKTEQEHNLVGELTETERNALNQNYEDLKREMSIDTSQLSEQNKIKTMLATKLALTKNLDRIRAEKSQLQEVVRLEQQDLEELKREKESLQEEIHNLDNVEISEENQKILSYVQELILKNETMKQQETEFKEKCKRELIELQDKIQKAEAAASDENIDEYQKQLDVEQERLKSLRLQLAKKNRAYVSINRQMDNIPDRTELAQYQRRFLELYNQVSAKHRETKQFYTLYNTLDDTKLYLEKEMSLLNSIYDNYGNAMLSFSSREQFLQQFENIVEGIRVNKTKVKRKCDDERAKRDGLNAQLLCLVEQQRKYAATVKQLTVECQRNEALLARYHQLQAAADQTGAMQEE